MPASPESPTRRAAPGLLACAVIVLAALAAAPPAAALQGYVNANLLRSWCKRDTTIDREACLSYLRGVFDTVTALRDAKETRGQGVIGMPGEICIPHSIPVTQLSIKFQRHMRHHPEDANHQASVVVMRSFRNAFPCS